MLRSMNRRRLRQVLTLMLGLLFALGTSASAFAVTRMAMKIAVTCDMSAMASNKCDGCADKGCGTATDCAVSLCATAVATLPQTLLMADLNRPQVLLVGWTILFGWPSSPDPYPPRARRFS